MKKIISLLTAAIMLLSASSAVLAANADDMQQTLISVKARITVPEELDKFESREYTGDGKTEYNFTWRTEDYKKSIDVSCNSDGIITSYNDYSRGEESRYDGKPSFSGMTDEEAKGIAEEFVGRINPDYPFQITVEDTSGLSLHNRTISFPISIYESGVKLSGENGYVTVDGERGKVTRFNIWFEQVEKKAFNSADDFISAEAAKTAYAEKFPAELVYRSYYTDESKRVFYPVYIQSSEYNEYINALTGEKQTIDFYKSAIFAASRNQMKEMGVAEDAAAVSGGGLSEQEIAEIDKINGLISKTDIEKRIKSNKVLAIPQNYKATSVRLYKEWNSDSYAYRLVLDTDKEEGNSIYVEADAKTGEVKTFYRSVDKMDSEGDKRDDKAFKTLAPEKSGEYEYDEDTAVYRRYVNGVRVEDDIARIAYTGGVLTSYSISYSEAEFPSVDGVMSGKEAAEAMLANGYEPVCVFGYDDSDKACLFSVYQISDVAVNPFTGKAVNYRNEEITRDENTPLEYSDISGHYAEQYIKELAKYNVGFEGGEFMPDAKLNQADLLILLDNVTRGNPVVITRGNIKDLSETTYSWAVDNDIISEDERDDNAVITRGKAAVYLIRAMGAEMYAKYNDIYVTPFSDVTENKGYIALLSAMGVVNGSGGKFDPQREITRAEFAIMLYNYLNK